MRVTFRYIIPLLIAGTLLSCDKGEIDLPAVVRHRAEGSVFSAIAQGGQSGQFVVTGGKAWEAGLWAESTDGGVTWKMDSLGNKQLFGLALKGDTLLTVGIDGHLFEKPPGEPWAFYRLSHWDILRDIVAIRSDQWLAVGGVAFNDGVIYHIVSGEIQRIQRFPHELQWILALDGQHLLAGGYGVVLRSANAGDTWEITGLEGDFFQGATRTGPQTALVAGYAGSVWKTMDGGTSWKKLRHPRWLGKLPGIRGIDFRDEQTGVICGDGGQLWLTTDGGDQWQAIRNAPSSVDWYDCLITGDILRVCGSEGTILEVALP